jgi:hypothetical protein
MTRGIQQRSKTTKMKNSIVKLQSVTRGHQQRKKMKKTLKKGGNKTRKNKKHINYNILPQSYSLFGDKLISWHFQKRISS